MGERQAHDSELEAFCRAEYPALVRLLTVYCGDRSTAEDLAQETLARVWDRWSRVRRLDAPSLWTRRVALNLAASWWRRRRTADRAAIHLRMDNHPAPTDDPPIRDDFLSLVAGLSPRQRAVLLLRFHEDLSVADTAAMLRVREGTVKALTSQALAALRAGGISGTT